MPRSVTDLRTCVDAARRDGRVVPAIEAWFDDGDEWTIGRETARFLTRLVEAMRPASVLEFGAGRSTAVIAAALSANGGGRLTSVDHQLAPAAPWLDRARTMAGVDLQTIASPLGVRATANGVIFTYLDAAAPIARRGPYDLVFVDAPPAAWGRDCALPLIDGALADPALIVLDDGARDSERACVRRWLATSRSLTIVLDDASIDRGLVALAHSGPARRAVSLRAIAGASWHLLRAWRRRRHVRRVYPLVASGSVGPLAERCGGAAPEETGEAGGIAAGRRRT